MKDSDCPLFKSCGKYAHWLLRLSFAAVFIYHGFGKLQNLAGFAEMAQLSMLVATLVALAEFLGGLAVLLGGMCKSKGGMLTKLGGLAVAPVMLGAIFMVHWGQWSMMPTETHPMGGIEFQVVLLSIALYFAVMGNQGAGCGCACKRKK